MEHAILQPGRRPQGGCRGKRQGQRIDGGRQIAGQPPALRTAGEVPLHDVLLILQALNELPPEQRRVLVLAYFGELSQTTIAASLGWPLGTVKKRVRLGLQKLRQKLAPRDVAGNTVGANGGVPPDGEIAPVLNRDRVRVDDGP